MLLENCNKLSVLYNKSEVGTLESDKYNIISFNYSPSWLKNGFSISPFSLPLKNKTFTPHFEPFSGVFGVFSDSLPDGWGRLLTDRLLLKHRINPLTVSNLTRLRLVNDSGMGALTYQPSLNINQDNNSSYNWDELSSECKKILENENISDLDEIFTLGGSSGGARPKVLTKIDGEEWIIKFPSSFDHKDIGKEEYEYSLVAKECGINVSETRLFPSKYCKGYFGTKRFDRVNGKRIHMVSLSGLLETSHRFPNLDYNIIMEVTKKLTQSDEDIVGLFRLMCFNVFAHNRDDHSKNFSFLYDDVNHKWHLSPAYDLTYSSSINGEHATTIDGEGKNVAIKNILNVAKNAHIDKYKAESIANDIKEKCAKLVKNKLF